MEMEDYEPSPEEYHVDDSLPVDSEEDPQEQEEDIDIEVREEEPPFLAAE